MPIEGRNSEPPALAALADAWLAEGASRFSISIDGRPVVSRTSRVSISGSELAAEIRRRGTLAGEIRVNDQRGRAVQARLAADAALVAEMLQAEADLATMTDELIQAQDQLLAVYDLAQLARRRVGVGETLVALAEAAARLLDVEGTAVVLAPDDRASLVVQYPPAELEPAWLLGLLPILQIRGQELFWQGQALSGQLPGTIRSLLMAPIDIGGTIQGGLAFWSRRDERFASPDIKLARAIAQHAGAQIENGLLHQERIAQARLETEMGLARAAQSALLPKTPPRMPGLGLYAHTRPALHVGGDYFDFLPDPGGSASFVVADVSGKGLSAALVMAMTRTLLRSVVGSAAKGSIRSSMPGPAELLALVNDEMYEDFTALAMFATVFAAQYRAEDRRLVYANAGHSPVVYMPAGKPARLLEADSAPIGVLRPSGCLNRVVQLGPGDLLVAASDGFNEARNQADELFGIDRLLVCIEANAHLPADALGPQLFAAVEAFSGGMMQEDDQTLVIAKGVSL